MICVPTELLRQYTRWENSIIPHYPIILPIIPSHLSLTSIGANKDRVRFQEENKQRYRDTPVIARYRRRISPKSMLR